MPTVITVIQNNTTLDVELQIPGYNTDRPILIITSLGIFNLFNYLTPDEIWAIQGQLEGLVSDGTFSILNTAIFPFTPVTSIQVDSNPRIVGDLQLISGSNVNLSQSGASVTVNASTPATTFHRDSFIVVSPSNHTLVLSGAPIANSEIITWNGLVLKPGISSDYVIFTNVVTLNSGLTLHVGDQFVVSFSA